MRHEAARKSILEQMKPNKRVGAVRKSNLHNCKKGQRTGEKEKEKLNMKLLYSCIAHHGN